MSWLARLKTGKTPEKDASKTTETIFVVSVAPTLAPLQKTEGTTEAAHGSAREPTPMAATVDIGTIRPLGLSPLLMVASLALDVSIVGAGSSPSLDPDDYCWPHSTAMNGAEIELFNARLCRFTDKGLTLLDGEVLADKLVLRDRDSDDRRICVECQWFAGNGPGSWRCYNSEAAGISVQLRNELLPVDFIFKPQRCKGFA